MHAFNRLVKLRILTYQWDPVASHSKSTEELLLALKYILRAWLVLFVQIKYSTPDMVV